MTSFLKGVGCMCALVALSSLQAYASDDEKQKVAKPHVMRDTIPTFSRGIKLAQINDDKLDFLGSVKVKGEAQFYSVYRSMDHQYADQVTPEKDLAFIAYPQNGGGNNAGVPLVNLNLIAKPTNSFSVDIGYSLWHGFTGQLQSEQAREATVRSNLNFGGTLNTDYGLFKIRAGGGVMWTSLSPLTMSALEPRRDEFDRLPWDWYTNSWQKYNDFYNSSVNLGGESYGNVALQGFEFSGQGLPLGLGFRAMYGRTNQSLDPNRGAEHFPNNLAAGRLEKSVGAHIFGGNLYAQFGNTDQINGIADNQTIVTTDAKLNFNGLEIYTELGAGRAVNPEFDGGWGGAGVVQVYTPESMTKIPLKFQFFNISNNVVSNVSKMYNSNAAVPNGAYGSDPNYHTMVFVNLAQDIGLYSNNRRGFSFSTGKKIGRFKFEGGLGLSQEIENLYDVITFQHRANAFSRSRFNPWFQNAGPYGRLKNVFRQSFEYLSITDAQNGISTDYLKGFGSIDFSVNYKTYLFGKELIFKNYTNYNSMQAGSFLPTFTDEAFLRTIYNQIIGFYQVGKKVSAVAFFEFERNVANYRTELSDYNRKPLDQYGEGIGFGIDYDFSKFAGIYLRHRFMYHDDVNFVKDKFQGQETTVELKVFF